MIRIKNLSKRIPGGPKVLDDISFEVYPGDFVAIKGESGSGKSMLLRCLALQEKWTEGSYIFDGKDVFKQGFSAKLKVKQQVAYVEEKPFCFQTRRDLKMLLSDRSRKRQLGAGGQAWSAMMIIWAQWI